MAILKANPDGTSNAKAGDIVVTGGGIFQKNADGTSTKLESLKDFIGKATTKDYGVLDTIVESYKARGNASVIDTAKDAIDNMQQSVIPETPLIQSDKVYNATVDSNGIVDISGYNPQSYASYENGTSDGTGEKILGIAVLALVGIAILDRWMNKPYKK